MPPALSIREQILVNIETTLAGITIAAGYATTIGTVTRGHLSPLENLGLPFASILPVNDMPEYGAGVLRRALGLTVRVWIDDAPVPAPTTLEALIADVQQVMQVDARRNGLAEQTLEGPVQYLYLGDTERLAGADVGFDIRYKTLQSTPRTGA